MKSLNTCLVSGKPNFPTIIPLRSYENTLLCQVVLFCQLASSLSYPQLLDNNPVSASISLFPRRFAAFQVRYFKRHNGWPNSCSLFSSKGPTVLPTFVIRLVLHTRVSQANTMLPNWFTYVLCIYN